MALRECRSLAVAPLCVPEPMLRSACVVSGDSVHAVTLISALQNAVGALGMVGMTPITGNHVSVELGNT